MWIFGYGSLIWKPNFAFVAAHDACLHGWKRRFYQGSPDHRGIPEKPGRVVTLLPEKNATCWGRVYRLAPAVLEETLAALDFREKAGYEHHYVELTCADGTSLSEVLVYVANATNENFLGEASLHAMAVQIAISNGPSGSNRDYLVNLAQSLRAMGVDDPHVFGLEAELKRVQKNLSLSSIPA